MALVLYGHKKISRIAHQNGCYLSMTLGNGQLLCEQNHIQNLGLSHGSSPYMIKDTCISNRHIQVDCGVWASSSLAHFQCARSRCMGWGGGPKGEIQNGFCISTVYDTSLLPYSLRIYTVLI